MLYDASVTNDRLVTIPERFLEQAERLHERPAFCVGTQSLSYGDLGASAQGLAKELERFGAQRVGLWISDPLRYVRAFFGVLLSGRAAYPIPAETPATAVRELCRRFAIDTIVSDQDEIPGSLSPHCAEFRGTLDRSLPGLSRGAEEFALVLLTSGTTGSSRAVPVTHRNLTWTSEIFNEQLGLSAPKSEPHRELVLVPLTHSFGVRRLVAEMLVGGCVYRIDGGFSLGKALDVLSDERCSVLSAVPSHIRALMHLRRDFMSCGSSLRHVELSSAFMSAAEKRSLVSVLPAAQIIMGYGLTEATRTALLRLDLECEGEHLGTVGRPFPGVTVSITDEDGFALPPGQEGCVSISGPNVAPGYLDGRELDQEKFSGGSYRTNDLGVLDAHGYLSLRGRSDDVINVGGEKVHPTELEVYLKERFPGLDCAIGKTPDRHLGERPILCVTGQPDTDLLAILRSQFEPYKVPLRVLKITAIPVTENGKIRRRELQRLITDSAAN